MLPNTERAKPRPTLPGDRKPLSKNPKAGERQAAQNSPDKKGWLAPSIGKRTKTSATAPKQAPRAPSIYERRAGV